jgi:hypothetical protein
MTFTVGDVMSRSLRILFANFVPFCLLSALFLVPDLLLRLMLQSSLAGPDQNMMLVITLMVLPIVLGSLITGALTYGVFQQMRGRPVGIGACISVGIQRLLPVLAVALVTGILIFLGFLALIVPGIILLCMWWLAVPAAVIENVGVGEAMRRSMTLTEGHRMTVFLIFLVIFAISIGVGMIFVLVMAIAGPTGIVIAGYIVTVAFTAWRSVANAVAYHDLRAMKEHVSIEDIAAVFD